VLVSKKRFGFGYSEIEEQKPGSMAIFCALCAQPGINLPEDWKAYENRCVYFEPQYRSYQQAFLAEPFLCEVS
jgi:hypothetical protein